MKRFLRDFGTYHPETDSYKLPSADESLFASIVQAGEFVGSLSASFIGDYLGRKGALRTAAVIVGLGTILQLIVTGSIPLLVVGRLVLGE